jgi:hypothetical protein
MPGRKSNSASRSSTTLGTAIAFHSGRGRSAPPAGRGWPGGPAIASLTKVPAPVRAVTNPSPVSRS